MGKRLIIIGFVVVAIAFGVFVFFVLRQGAGEEKIIGKNQDSGSRRTEKAISYKSGEFQPPKYEQTASSESANWTLGMPKEPEFKPLLEQEKDKIAETFLERFDALSNSSFFPDNSAVSPSFSGLFEKKTPVLPTTGANTATSKNRAQATSTEIILSLTYEEFHYLYPDSFLNSLIIAQDVLIKEYDPSYKPFVKIENDSQVRFIEEKIVESFLLADMMTQEKADRSIKTIRSTLPQLQITELKNRKSPVSVRSAPTNMNFSKSKIEHLVTVIPPELLGVIFNKTILLSLNAKESFFADLMKKIYSAFIPKAQAAPCGYCFDLPECYKVGASIPAVGSNTWAGKCYCTGCLKFLGCLSRCSLSAIWDPLPPENPLGTGICGCG